MCLWQNNIGLLVPFLYHQHVTLFFFLLLKVYFLWFPKDDLKPTFSLISGLFLLLNFFLSIYSIRLNITNFSKITSLLIRNLEDFEFAHNNLYPFTPSTCWNIWKSSLSSLDHKGACTYLPRCTRSRQQKHFKIKTLDLKHKNVHYL